MDLPTSWSATHGWMTSWVLPCLAAALLALRYFAHRANEAGRMDASARARLERGVTVGLLLAAALSVATYVDFGRFRYGTYVNEWDTYHYYLGTKYLAELGYDGLYEATVLADHESVHLFRGENVRDLRTYELVPTQVALESARRLRARFTPERWREFVADVAWFERRLPSDRLAILLEDHGYNGSPRGPRRSASSRTGSRSGARSNAGRSCSSIRCCSASWWWPWAGPSAATRRRWS